MREKQAAGAPARVVHGVCPHDCFDTCGLEIEVQGEHIQRIRGQKDHPITQGFACLKVNRYLERIEHPQRVLYPMKRTGPKGSGQFLRATWNEAMQDIGRNLQTIVEKHGGEAVLPYSFSGNMGVLSEASMDRRFFHKIGASRLTRTICTASADAALMWVYGRRLGPDPETLQDAGMIFLWGSNPVATNIHEVPMLDRAVQRGARIVVVDPLNTGTVQRYGGHVALKPGTDAALALGLCAYLLDSGLYDKDFVQRYAYGLDGLSRRARQWSLDRTERVTGIGAEDIVALAHQMMRTKPLVIRTGYGMQRQIHAAEAVWAVSALSVLTGSYRDAGGGHLLGNGDAFPLNWTQLTRPDLLVGQPREVNMLELGNALNTVENPRIRALVVYNSNPAATAPDQGAVLAGLRREDLYTIVHEQMMTDTARYADWILPAAMSMEILDLHTSYWHRYVQLNEPAVPPPAEAVSNTEFFRRLARAVGLGSEQWVQDTDEMLIRQALDTSHPWLAGITLERLREYPVQKVRIAKTDRPLLHPANRARPLPFCLDPLPAEDFAEERAPAGYPYVLLTPSRKNTIKSSFANLPGLLRDEPEPSVYMHPHDALGAGLRSGQTVRVCSAQGQIDLRLEVSSIAQPGVVVSYAVRWNHESGGVNINVLTSQTLSDYGGGSTFYSTWVKIELVGETVRLEEA